MMANFEWIMSEGGPLICVEPHLAASWGGIYRLSIKQLGAATDYDRACAGSSEALSTVPLERGVAMFCQAPFDTSFWSRARDGKVFIISIEACEFDTDFDVIMNGLDEAIFDTPVQQTIFEIVDGSLQLFDSAFNGDDRERKHVGQKIEPGIYNIKTAILETDHYYLWLHRFDRQA